MDVSKKNYERLMSNFTRIFTGFAIIYFAITASLFNMIPAMQPCKTDNVPFTITIFLTLGLTLSAMAGLNSPYEYDPKTAKRYITKRYIMVGFLAVTLCASSYIKIPVLLDIIHGSCPGQL